MKNVIVASLNPAKINAVKSAFHDVFPDQAFHFQGVSVASGISPQPMNDNETKQGARNRVSNAEQAIPDADYYVSLEAGIENGSTFAWMIIKSGQRYGESRSASLPLPPMVAEQLTPDNELGHVMDKVFATENIKQKGGAIGLLTRHKLTRSSVYHQALILALIPFTNPDLFPINNLKSFGVTR